MYVCMSQNLLIAVVDSCLSTQVVDLDQRDGSRGFSVLTIATSPETITLDKTSQKEMQENIWENNLDSFIQVKTLTG